MTDAETKTVTPCTAEAPADEARKRPAPETPDTDAESPQPEAKRVRRGRSDPIPERDPAEVKRQIEYYLSDKNLAYDVYFRDEIVSAGEGFVPYERFLSCRKIQIMKADVELIKTSLEASETVETSDEGIRRKGNPPLPELQERSPQGVMRKKKMFNKGVYQRKPLRPHQYGCLVEVRDIPDDISWPPCKNAVNQLLSPIFKPHLAEGLDAVNYCNLKGDDRAVRMVLRPFDGDITELRAFFRGKKLDLDGALCPVLLSDSQICARKFFNALGKRFYKKFEPVIAEVAIGAVEVGGVPFDTVEDMRNCITELMRSTERGSAVTETGKKVLSALLDHHPDGDSKKRDMDTIIVDRHPDSGEDDNNLVFHVKRSDGTTEDFSFSKCIWHLVEDWAFKTPYDRSGNFRPGPAPAKPEAGGVPAPAEPEAGGVPAPAEPEAGGVPEPAEPEAGGE